MSILAVIAVIAPAVVSGYTLGAHDGAAGWIEDHNYYRCKHGAAPVYWDDDLAAKAQAWADNLASIRSLVHSNCYSNWPYSGENLAWGSGNFTCSGKTGTFSQRCAINNWYSEYQNWQCKGNWPDVVGEFGHFTAMVWKGIDRIGCGSNNGYHVCEYGSSQCKVQTTDSFGGYNCWGGNPSHLANFNSYLCTGNQGQGCVGCLSTATNIEATCAAAQSPVYYGGAASTTTTVVPTTVSSTTTTTTTKSIITTVKPTSTTVVPTTATSSTTVKPTTTTVKPTTKPLPVTTTSTTTRRPRFSTRYVYTGGVNAASANINSNVSGSVNFASTVGTANQLNDNVKVDVDGEELLVASAGKNEDDADDNNNNDL